MTPKECTESLYYTPDISDLRIGYSCLFNITPSWKEEEPNWIEIILKEDDAHKYSPYDGDMSLIDEVLRGVKENRVKVPFLTKEDIESLNYRFTKYDGSSNTFQKIITEYEFLELDYDYETKKLIVEQYYQTSLVATSTGKYNMNTLFIGECKSINELKTILKLLNI